MGKISKLLVAGLGFYAYKYYSKRPEKLEEHKGLLKEKLDNSIKYSKDIVENTKENGISSSAEILKNDFEKVVNNSYDKVQTKVNETVEFGKQFSSDAQEVKDNVIEVKEQGIELTANTNSASKIVKEEVLPKVEEYKEEAKNIIENITDKVKEIKDTINTDKVSEKISDFKEKVEETVSNTKETINNITKKSEDK